MAKSRVLLTTNSSVIGSDNTNCWYSFSHYGRALDYDIIGENKSQHN